MTEFGRALKKCCIDVSMTIGEFAKELGYASSTIHAFANGGRKPTLTFVLECTRVFSKHGVQVPDNFASLAGVDPNYVDASGIGAEHLELVRKLIKARLTVEEVGQLEQLLTLVPVSRIS